MTSATLPPGPLSAPPLRPLTVADLPALLGPGARALEEAVARVLQPSLEAGNVGMRGPLPSGAPFLAADVRLMAVPDLVRWSMGGQHAGAVVQADDSGGRAIFLEGGRCVGAVSTHRADRLGEVLWRQGRISLDQLMIASASRTAGSRLGRTLVELGYLGTNDLYRALRTQALATLQEACTVSTGYAVFLHGLAVKNPLPLDGADAVVAEAAEKLAQCVELERALAPMELPVLVARRHGGRKLEEAEAAMIQLAASSRPPLTRAALLQRMDLGRLERLETMLRLVDDGFLVAAEQPVAPPPPPPVSTAENLRAMCLALNACMAALKDGGFGMEDTVLALKDAPPEHVAEGMAWLSMTVEGVDADEVEATAQANPRGAEQLRLAVRELTVFALFEARDTLDEDSVAALNFEVEALGVKL